MDNYEDTKIFIDYLNHKNYWLAVFRPDVKGETQAGGPLENTFCKSKKSTLEIIKNFNGRGLVCLAINEHANGDQTIQSINRLHSLIIDIDVKKALKKGFVSLKEHHDLALKQAQEITKYLEDKGFKTSLILDSGNGAHIYIYVDEKFNEDFINNKEKLYKEYKDKLQIKAYKDEFNKLLRNLWEEQDIYKKLVAFETDLKQKFQTEILAIDNITKDINRRMKVAGVINKKDIEQTEDRTSKIIYYNKDYLNTSNLNIITLNKYEIIESNTEKQSIKSEIVTNENLQILQKWAKLLQSKKDTDKQLIQTFKGQNLTEMFGGDRSNAEQSLVNLLVHRGFSDFSQVDTIMNKCSIGKWQESKEQYKTKTFDKAKALYTEYIERRESKKNEITKYFSRFRIFLLTDEPKTKYAIYDPETKIFTKKEGDENLSNWLYITAINQKVNLEDLSLFYFGSKKSLQSLLLDFMKDSQIIETINDIKFKPVNSLTFYEDYKTYFNTYKPHEFLILNKSKENIDFKKQCPNIYQVIENITGNDINGLQYLIKLLAFMLQNPHIKTGKLIVFFGEEAAGKGIFYSHILKKLFGQYAGTITGRDLDTNYNGFLSEKIILYINEVSNKKEYENTLKNWITEEEISINNKYGSNKTERTYFTIFADVNGEHPIQAGERRGVYFKSKTLGRSLLLAPEIGEKLAQNIPKEINLFAQYLMNVEVSYTEINKGYDTQAKKDIMSGNSTLEDKFLEEMFSYSDFNAFITATNANPENRFHLIVIGEWIKNGFIEINLFLNLYNLFRKKAQLKEITIHRFSWFYDKLDIDREDKTIYNRSYNDSGKNVYWLHSKIIGNKYAGFEKWEKN